MRSILSPYFFRSVCFKLAESKCVCRIYIVREWDISGKYKYTLCEEDTCILGFCFTSFFSSIQFDFRLHFPFFLHFTFAQTQPQG